jgi:maltose alpha-D-glucosyltransferase/alpha-amylase
VHPEPGNARWYEQAIFYEVFVRGFADANVDGQGDLRGLTSRLDYLEWLGVDCIWLLPFYQSPLRDGGYDISDFFTILPAYGVLADAVELVEEAHARGMRVVADLVLNHTSDQHPWFQESRQDRVNAKADWYVWGDDDQRWSEARVIFHDTETSNWSWDPVRQQYFWHRFFGHQPDLNFDNPEVSKAVIDVVRFWLDIGLDGFRLDAVPYLFERDGTNGENLPETHAFLKQLRKEIDFSHPGKVLLAEANQWPSDVLDYFGDGDECHMCFNFPLMPRMYLAAKRGERGPIERILAELPEIPAGCQWGLFLRNHDELTLEMVTDVERDEMYAEYARDPKMRRNTGIGRRLAPLLDNNRPLMELFHALLFSLPGSPVMYYGDEIGMGDNIFLGDRDGVRTPMQWTPDRNAGFSASDFEQLYLPPIMDPVYGYQAVNVEAQRRNPGSFLHWIRRMIDARSRHPQLAIGSYEMVPVHNQAVFVYVRGPADYGANPILCVANLSRQAQPVEVPLEQYNGRTPVELLGKVAFPPIGELTYLLTLPPHGFLWFELV